MPEVESRGYRIYYESQGFGAPLLLIPGLMMTTKRWELAGYQALASRFQLITLDTLGHGRSDRPHDPAAYERRSVAADVIAVMDAAGVSKAHVWGYSRGAAIAANVATLYPERVRGLVLGGFAVVSTNAAPAQDRLASRVQERAEALKRDDWEAYWVSMSLPRNPQLESALQSGTEAGALAAIIQASGQPPGFDNDFAPFRDRMLVYAGTNDLGLQDPAATKTFRHNCEAIGARLELLEGINHAQAFQASDRVMPFVRQFLGSMTAK